MATPRRSARLSTSSLPSPSLLDTKPESKIVKSRPNKKRKATATTASNIDNDGFAIPQTPKRKRTKTDHDNKSPIKAPETPTPAAASQMGTGVPYSSVVDDDISSERQTLSNRVANPLGTNAMLISPMTSRVVSQKPTTTGISPSTNISTSDTSPSKTAQGGALPVRSSEQATGVGEGYESTTDSILEEALKHLIKVDPRLEEVIEKHPCRVFAREGLMEVIDPFASLVSGIISQQVSGAAAKSIKNKFISLFNPSAESATPSTDFPAPNQVAATSIETLRTAGLSQRKAEYIQGLAAKFANGELTTEFLMNAEYEEVLEELVKVRGLGKWSVEMFACFSLKRMDVFSTGDLGVQRGMAALEGRDVSKLKAKGGGKWKYMSEKEMLEISSRFAPYRSVFMWYMWRVEDTPTDISTLES